MVGIGEVIEAMISYYAGDTRRINHLLKVYGFAKAIGEREGLDERDQHILEVAALTHDIGIKVSESRYGDCSGKHQEVEGPPEARRMLLTLGCNPEVVDRVCWLIAHHHTYDDIEGLDYQILVEADFLVNMVEDALPLSAVDSIMKRIFRTATGSRLLELYIHGQPG
jgi:HD superfamily phosphodiesterase